MAMPSPSPDRQSMIIKFMLVIVGIVLAIYGWYNYLR